MYKQLSESLTIFEDSPLLGSRFKPSNQLLYFIEGSDFFLDVDVNVFPGIGQVLRYGPILEAGVGATRTLQAVVV